MDKNTGQLPEGVNGTHLVFDDVTEWMACDLVRRAKALAGVSE